MFVKQVVSRFRDKCLLCGKKHPVKIHTYVDRSYEDPQQKEKKEGETKRENMVIIVVPRLYCPVNHRRRKDSGEPKQYTITVLPGFLVPYSRILVDTIHAALHGYLLHGDAQGRSYEQAAYTMNCAQPVSFARYLARVKLRLPAWIVTLTDLLVDLGVEITQADEHGHGGQDLRRQWMCFLYLVTKIVQARVVAEPLRWQYVYGMFSYQRMGLGP